MTTHLPDPVFLLDSNSLGSVAEMGANGCVLVVLLAFAALERRSPLRYWSQAVLRQSYKTNASLFVANNLLLSLMALPGLLALAEQHTKPILAGYLAWPGQVILAFLLFDLSLYLWHRASHRSPWLWQFHRIHHSDATMNVTTAFRLHVMDHVTMVSVKAAYILLLGFSKETVLLNEFINTLFLIFHHSNISFKGEQWLGQIIINPKLHRLHHSTERHEHDRNYGAVFSVWDRLFKTLAEVEPKHLGIKEDIAQDWLGLMLAGFVPAHALQPKAQIPAYALNAMIAEAAYYKAEKRNFKPGNELADWLEAKREIIKQLYGSTPKDVKPANLFYGLQEGSLCC